MFIVLKLSRFSIDSNIQIWLHGLPDYLPIFVNVSKNAGLSNIVVKNKRNYIVITQLDSSTKIYYLI